MAAPAPDDRRRRRGIRGRAARRRSRASHARHARASGGGLLADMADPAGRLRSRTRAVEGGEGADRGTHSRRSRRGACERAMNTITLYLDGHTRTRRAKSLLVGGIVAIAAVALADRPQREPEPFQEKVRIITTTVVQIERVPASCEQFGPPAPPPPPPPTPTPTRVRDRKSTRLNSSHSQISYAVFCLKK